MTTIRPLRGMKFDFEGTQCGYFVGGDPGKLPLLMMHGIGPGASVSGAFAAIFEFLLDHFNVFAMDFVGFGTSGKKTTPPFFDFAAWVRQAEKLLSVMPQGPLGIFGHSMGGAVALRLAAQMPNVKAVITTGTAGTRFPVSPDLERLWTFPQSLNELRMVIRSLVFRADLVPDAELERRWSILGAPGYGDYFSRMFEGDRAFKQGLIDQSVLLNSEIATIRTPVTLVHGREDHACRWEDTSLPLSTKLKRGDLMLLGECGHAPAMEHPHKVIACVKAAFDLNS